MPASAAIWLIGSGVAAWAISMSLGTGIRRFDSLWGMFKRRAGTVFYYKASGYRDALLQVFEPVQYHLNLWCRRRPGPHLAGSDHADEMFAVGKNVVGPDTARDRGREIRPGRAHWRAETHAGLRGDAYAPELPCSRDIEKLFSVRRPNRMMRIRVFRGHIDRGRSRERSHVDTAAGLGVQLVRDPVAIRRKHAPVKTRARSLRKYRGFLVAQGIRPYRGRAILLLGERKHLAVRRPGIGDVRDPFVRFGKPLGDSIAVGTLPPDAEVALPIRLERDPLVVGRPYGIPIRSRSRKRKPARGRGPGQLVNPNARFLAVVHLIRDSFAVPRNARERVGARRNLQRLDFPFTIHQSQNALPHARGSNGTRNVDQLSRARKG